MKEKLFLSTYYDDPDHPSGIVALEFKEENFEKYKLMKDLYEELISSDTKKVTSNYYQVQQEDPDFDQHLVDEINLACKENTILAKDRGWDNFQFKKYLGWVIVELSRDKKEFYNDSFWKII
tara:strand:+ start:28 stop:393 length:366 start_codon:yes stop_codon:yes gene_type:complete